MIPRATAKAYTCKICGHNSPYVVAEECHSCWMKRVQGETQVETLLPQSEDEKG